MRLFSCHLLLRLFFIGIISVLIFQNFAYANSYILFSQSITNESAKRPENCVKDIKEAFFTILGALIAGLIGLYGSWLQDRKEAKSRVRDFNGFLCSWRKEIFSALPVPFGSQISNPSYAAFHAKIPLFCERVERVRDFFSGDKNFHKLTERIANLKEQDWDKKQPKDVICGALDELIEFVNHNL